MEGEASLKFSVELQQHCTEEAAELDYCSHWPISREINYRQEDLI